MVSLRALTCSGHTRPVVDLAFSDETEDRSFLISACKGEFCFQFTYLLNLGTPIAPPCYRPQL